MYASAGQMGSGYNRLKDRKSNLIRVHAVVLVMPLLAKLEPIVIDMNENDLAPIMASFSQIGPRFSFHFLQFNTKRFQVRVKINAPHIDIEQISFEVIRLVAHYSILVA